MNALSTHPKVPSQALHLAPTLAARKSTVARSAQLRFIDEFEVWVTRKSVKNLNLHIKPDGRIEVSAPLRISDKFIDAFIREKASWIRSHLKVVEDSPSKKAGQASTAEMEEWRQVISAFTPPLVEKWEPILGVKANKLVYRNMTSRWGSCQPATGRICINIRLALYPPECLEYVVVHELCHLLVRGHGADFKALLDAHLPDWRVSRDKLR